MDTIDPFSRLPNRTAFRIAVHEALRRVDAAPGSDFSIVVMALESLANVNARYGLATGDAYLFAWAQRLRRMVADRGHCFYVFGSHFAVLMPGAEDMDADHQQLLQWYRALVQPFELAEKRLEVNLAMGVVSAPADGRDFDELLANANAARDEAKALGGERIAHFSADKRRVADSQLQLVTDLSAAVEEGAFELHYQPTVNIETGEIVSLEALIRWRHPDKGLVAPLDFIAVAEETGLIHAIGRWTLRQLLKDLAQWQATHARTPCFSFNVSPQELAEYGFIDALDRILDEHAAPLPQLEIEITENLMVHYPERSARILRRLQSRGFHVAIDDFGSGYASLLYLQRFPVNKIKVDRMYTEGVVGNRRERALVSAAIQLARDLDAQLVAEGVETTEQLEELRKLGCQLVQGYLFCRPLPMPALISWVDGFDAMALKMQA